MKKLIQKIVKFIKNDRAYINYVGYMALFNMTSSLLLALYEIENQFVWAIWFLIQVPFILSLFIKMAISE